MRLVLAIVLVNAITVRSEAAAFPHFEARHTHPIGLSPNGTKLIALNTPDSRVSIFDVSNLLNPVPVLVAEIPVGLEPVSVRARTEDEVWIVNEVSDSVSIVSINRGTVVETLRCEDEPADVVFAQGKAFVSCARNNLIRVFDVTTRVEVAVIPLEGLNPRAMAADANGKTVFAAFQLSGNRTTILPPELAPPPPTPSNSHLPLAPQVALIVPADDLRIPYTVIDRDVVAISAVSNNVSRYFSDAGTVLFDLAVRPGGDELWVANTEALNLIRFEPNLRGHFADNRLTRIAMAGGVPNSFDLNPGVDYGMLPNPVAQSKALAQPTAIVFSPEGGVAWVAAFASDRVAKINAINGEVLARVDVRFSRRKRPPTIRARCADPEDWFYTRLGSNSSCSTSWLTPSR